MGTGALVGRIEDDGAVAGRTVHYDGHPDTCGVALQHGYAVLGYDRLVALLCDEHRGGWSGLYAENDWTAEPIAGRLTDGAPLACYCHGEHPEQGDVPVIDSPAHPCSYVEFVYGLRPDGILVRRSSTFRHELPEFVVAWDDEATMRSITKLLRYVD